MVSGFLTSPWDHARISSAVARPIRNSSKKLTSSTGDTSLSVGISGDHPAAGLARPAAHRDRGWRAGPGAEQDSREVSPAPPQAAFRAWWPVAIPVTTVEGSVHSVS